MKQIIPPLAGLLLMQIIISCTPAPIYTGGDKPKSTGRGRSREIAVTHNPTLSYQKVWTGVASWYGKDFHNKLTANGETFDMYAMTAAHKTLPLGTVVRVTNLDNKKSALVRINDRGPYIEGRLIDLSYAAARELGFAHLGTARVKLQVVKWGDNSYKSQDRR